MKKISRFQGEYRWLSNFATGSVQLANGETYRCREGAYQAAKSEDPRVRAKFFDLNGLDSKKLGRQIKLRPDWDEIKDQVMYDVCKAYYLQNEEPRQKLIDSGDIYLEEGNYWGDTYWGVYKDVGLNKLGEILMKIRDELSHL